MSKRRNRKRSGGIARQDYTKGGRVGYQRGRKVVVDRETGEVLENFKAAPTPAPRPTPAPAPRPAPNLLQFIDPNLLMCQLVEYQLLLQHLRPTPAPTPAPAPTRAPTPAPTLHRLLHQL